MTFRDIVNWFGEGSAIADLIINIKRTYDQVYTTLPEHVKAKINKGDSFQRFATVIAQLEPAEREAVRDFLDQLHREDPSKFEHFILHAIIRGGLENDEPTRLLLKDIATMDYDETKAYLERLKYFEAIPIVPSHVVQAATALQGFEATVSADIDNSPAMGLLDHAIAAMRQKTGL